MKTTKKKKNYDEDSDIGCIPEVDVEYPNDIISLQ